MAEHAARAATVTMGLPIDVDPHVALLQEVHRAAGVVAWLAAEVARIDPDHVGFGVTKETVTEGDGGGEGETAGTPGRKTERAAAPHVLVKMWGDERDRLVRAAKAAIDAGVSERLVRLEEAKGEIIVAMLRRIFDDPELALTDDQRQAARTVAARELRALPEAG